jgi:hypothetical protein
MRALLLAAALSLAACTPTDVGQCCQAADPALVPPPAIDQQGRPANSIAVDPQFLCSDLTCVSYEGSQSYCTQRCEFDSNCPGDFVCANVVVSDPGPDADFDASQKFCVKSAHACD